MTKISTIVAADENNAIGNEGGMLCHLPNDLKYFKNVTSNHSIIMGRKTFESLPKGALPNRRNIVITRNSELQYDRCEMCSSLEEVIRLCRNEDEMFIIGGGSIYKEAIELSDQVYLTRIHHVFDNVDTFFPTLDSQVWLKVFEERHEADEKNKYAHSFIRLEKNRG